uniref:Uncharacterized protein n=1 Tax=Cacopsylla melanoneura TaxID=428564 RepID=A0A8D8X612_9HEMI
MTLLPYLQSIKWQDIDVGTSDNGQWPNLSDLWYAKYLCLLKEGTGCKEFGDYVMNLLQEKTVESECTKDTSTGSDGDICWIKFKDHKKTKFEVQYWTTRTRGEHVERSWCRFSNP